MTRAMEMVLVLCLALPAAAQDVGFAVKDKAGDALDIVLDGKVAARYMYAYDKSTDERRKETYKPYLHVFDATGAYPITNGPAGLYPHHRGIYIGWNKIGFEGKSYDRWHMLGGEIVHKKFSDVAAGKDKAAFTSHTQWLTDMGKVILDEERTMTFRKPDGAGRLLIDAVFKLTAPNGDVTLGGDPEHAGIHFRPANEVTKSETIYVFPGEKAVPTKDVDYPWVGETFGLKGNKHSVVLFNHPDNPKNTRFSAYRDYGRFGAFPTAEIKQGESRTFRYRFLIADGAMPSAAEIQRIANDFTGTESPVPPTTVIPAMKK